MTNPIFTNPQCAFDVRDITYVGEIGKTIEVSFRNGHKIHIASGSVDENRKLIAQITAGMAEHANSSK